jgi:hypothetical protein
MNIELCSDQTHLQQLSGCLSDIFLCSVRTFEYTTYTKIAVTTGILNNERMGLKTSLGQGGNCLWAVLSGERWGYLSAANYSRWGLINCTMPLYT